MGGRMTEDDDRWGPMDDERPTMPTLREALHATGDAVAWAGDPPPDEAQHPEREKTIQAIGDLIASSERNIGGTAGPLHANPKTLKAIQDILPDAPDPATQEFVEWIKARTVRQGQIDHQFNITRAPRVSMLGAVAGIMASVPSGPPTRGRRGIPVSRLTGKAKAAKRKAAKQRKQGQRANRRGKR